MIEITTDATLRNAFRRAHVERANVMKSAWNWLFGSR